MIVTRNAAFIRSLTHFATARYFFIQLSLSMEFASTRLARDGSFPWCEEFQFFFWKYFYKAQSGQKKENERRNSNVLNLLTCRQY